MSTPPVPPPPKIPVMSWCPRRTSGTWKLHTSVGLAKSAIRGVKDLYDSHRDWPEAAIWQWDGAQWVLLFHTVEGQVQDPW